MIRMLDKFLLFVFSLVAGIGSLILLLMAFKVIPYNTSSNYVDYAYHNILVRNLFIVFSLIFVLVSARFFYIAIRPSQVSGPSIDQRTDYGDIRISLETIENLSLKAAAKVKGVKDLKTRVKVSELGLEIVIRTIVDGESSIPALTEEVQRSVKFYIEETTGIPVASVSIFVANIIQSNTFKSRVE